MRWLRNPSVQFLSSLLWAPLIAIAGASWDGFAGPVGALSGAATCGVIAALASRSYRYERQQFGPQNLWRQTGTGRSPLLRYLIGVATLLVFFVPATIVLFVIAVFRTLAR